MNSIQMTPVEQRSAGVGEIPAVLLPTLGERYRQRAARLRQLAEAHPMADYLLFVAQVADAQQHLLERLPLPAPLVSGLAARLADNKAPLAWASLPRDAYWQQLLHGLGEHIEHATLQGLCALDAPTLDAAADALLAGRFNEIDSGQALFLWAALSLYFTQMAAHLPAIGSAGVGEQRQHCPVCTGAPVASVILTGAQTGLRYLHCGLCESRWHMVRLKCSNCEETGSLDYWSLHTHETAIKAESCGDCHSYLKVFYPEHERDLELVADDLASIALDAEVERQGFDRSGVSPFLFPG